MLPIETSCPKCAAQCNEACDWKDWNFAQPHPEFHSDRIGSAAAFDWANSQPVSNDIIDKAVDQLGID